MIGIPDDKWGEVVHAIIVCRDDAVLTEGVKSPKRKDPWPGAEDQPRAVGQSRRARTPRACVRGVHARR